VIGMAGAEQRNGWNDVTGETAGGGGSAGGGPGRPASAGGKQDQSSPCGVCRRRGPRAKSGESDRHEALDRGLGRQVTGTRQRVQTESGQLVRADVVPDVTCLRRLGQEAPYEVTQVLLGMRHMIASAQERRKLPFATSPLLLDERVRLQNRGEPFAGAAGAVAQAGQLIQLTSSPA
jgi:hypothetical protein